MVSLQPLMTGDALCIQDNTTTGNQQAAELPPGSSALPWSPLKLREIDAKVSGPTQQLLAVLHGLQSELESAESRQQSVQVATLLTICFTPRSSCALAGLVLETSHPGKALLLSL